MEFPARWNRSLETEHVTRTKVSDAIVGDGINMLLKNYFLDFVAIDRQSTFANAQSRTGTR